MSGLAIIQDPEAAGAALRPLRRKVLHALREPGSASSVGAELGIPRQKVNYHLRALERAGLVEHVDDRKKGNCVERIVRATATHYLVSPGILGEDLGPPRLDPADRLSSDYLAAASARTVQDLGTLVAGAAETGKRLPTFALETVVRFATPADGAAFLDELSVAITELVHRYHDEHAEGGRRFRLLTGAHPAVPRDGQDPTTENPA